MLHILSRDTITDLLWYAIYFNPRKNSHTRPGWNGYMSKVTAGDFPGKSVVKMLPIIDVNPGDMSCIFSTLTFIINQAKELNITTPVLTVDHLKDFIRAERTGNWKLHLPSVRKMLNMFAATGHMHYVKSARLYLQQMMELETDYPWVYKNFTENGYHTIRRSNKFWAGLWSDLIIEQVMMRSLKSRGGITRGRGVTELYECYGKIQLTDVEPYMMQ